MASCNVIMWDFHKKANIPLANMKQWCEYEVPSINQTKIRVISVYSAFYAIGNDRKIIPIPDEHPYLQFKP